MFAAIASASFVLVRCVLVPLVACGTNPTL
jgi:hypothetical protein